jgi:hypothetical protein
MDDNELAFLEHMQQLEAEYINYCIKCIPNQTPKSFNEWMHTEPTQTSNDNLPF